jgi:DNA-binding NarL/FixJ family response regulator
MPTPLKTRVLLADDHTVVRSGLRMVLDAQPDIQVVAEAGDGAGRCRRRSAPMSISRSWTSQCRA